MLTKLNSQLALIIGLNSIAISFIIRVSQPYFLYWNFPSRDSNLALGKKNICEEVPSNIIEYSAASLYLCRTEVVKVNRGQVCFR